MLRGREILLAGGSGGLGSGSAELLISEGARVVIGFRANHERAEKWSDRAKVVQADITQAEDRARLLDSCPQLYGLVIFAGDPSRPAPGEAIEETMRRAHDANYLGPILLAREAAQQMRAAGIPGSIVVLTTMQAAALFPGSSVYAAPKAALAHAIRILAKECRGPANIRVNAISPGVMQAGMAEASIASGKYERFLQEGIISRYGAVVDIARTVRFLLEPDNYITGQILCVDGGITL